MEESEFIDKREDLEQLLRDYREIAEDTLEADVD